MDSLGVLLLKLHPVGLAIAVVIIIALLFKFMIDIMGAFASNEKISTKTAIQNLPAAIMIIATFYWIYISIV